MVTLRRLRVGVATPDPGLAARIALVAMDAGHDVVSLTDDPVDAMEAAFSRSVEVLVLDQQLHRLTGTEIAGIVRSAGAGVTVVVLERGDPGSSGDLPVLDPTLPGFDGTLAKVLARAVEEPETAPPPRPRRRAG